MGPFSRRNSRRSRDLRKSTKNFRRATAPPARRGPRRVNWGSRSERAGCRCAEPVAMEVERSLEDTTGVPRPTVRSFPSGRSPGPGRLNPNRPGCLRAGPEATGGWKRSRNHPQRGDRPDPPEAPARGSARPIRRRLRPASLAGALGWCGHDRIVGNRIPAGRLKGVMT